MNIKDGKQKFTTFETKDFLLSFGGNRNLNEKIK